MDDFSYINWSSMSDLALAKSIGEFIKHHRIGQNKTQDAVAESAGISRSTLSLLERGEPVTLATLLRVLRVLDLLNIMETFQIKKQISPLEQTKLEQQKRQRARKTKTDEQTESDW